MSKLGGKENDVLLLCCMKELFIKSREITYWQSTRLSATIILQAFIYLHKSFQTCSSGVQLIVQYLNFFYVQTRGCNTSVNARPLNEISCQ
jgi:hypothetical protein